MSEKILTRHKERKAVVYVRQSSLHQVRHNNESRRLQYAMKQRVIDLGWAEVEIIDDDLGRSGASTTERVGFQRMVTEVCLGKVGAVAAIEVSRFARNNRDWHQLIEMCSLVDTLLIDHESVYDPRCANDRLLLGLKGSMSEYELDLLRQRSLEARWSKARRGELVMQSPIGFIRAADQCLELDPDKRVQNAINMVFAKFFELGAARQVLMYFIEEQIELPTLRYEEDRFATVWRRPKYQLIMRFLTNPSYAGAYCFGRTKHGKRMIDGVLRKTSKHQPMRDWGVLIPEHHPGYISWPEFEKIQSMLKRNVSNFRTDGLAAAKHGSALLGGLLRCRRCGSRLRVLYTGREGAIPAYTCRRGHLDNAESRCIQFGGTNVDQAVSAELLHVIEPAAVEAAAIAATDVDKEHTQRLEALSLEAKEARYAAERARRQFDAVDPENRLVTEELERRWDIALRRQRELETRFELAQAETPKPIDKAALSSLAKDLKRVWDDPRTDVRLKKRIIRTLVQEIIVDVDSVAGDIELVIRWKGDIHSAIHVRRRRRGQNCLHTAKEAVEAVEILTRICSDDVIVNCLNRSKMTTGHGNRWTRERVVSLRSHHGIAIHNPERQRHEGWLNLSQAAKYLGVAPTTLRHAIETGQITGLHPLPVGPWVLRRADLDAPSAQQVILRARSCPAAPNSRQLTLINPNT